MELEKKEMIEVFREGIEKAFNAKTAEEKDLILSELISNAQKIINTKNDFIAKLTVIKEGIIVEGNCSTNALIESPKIFQGFGEGLRQYANNLLKENKFHHMSNEKFTEMKINLLFATLTGFGDIETNEGQLEEFEQFFTKFMRG